MQIVWTLLASIGILYVWIWLINTAFGKDSLKLSYVWKILTIWIVLVGGLFFYKYLASHLEYLQWYNLLEHFNYTSLVIFGGYCAWILLLLILLFRKRKIFILQVFLGGAIFFAMVSIGGLLLWINSLVLYYIVAAYAEEYMKYTSSTTFIERTADIKDNIFFCVLLGLGFSLIENILYLVSLAGWWDNILGLIVWRWLISALLHVVATTTIWTIYYALKQKIIRPVALFISILGGLALHGWYNLWLFYHLSIVTIPLVIFFFFLLSFFLFKSDLLYAQKQ
jgi:hypothetical protein